MINVMDGMECAPVMQFVLNDECKVASLPDRRLQCYEAPAVSASLCYVHKLIHRFRHSVVLLIDNPGQEWDVTWEATFQLNRGSDCRPHWKHGAIPRPWSSLHAARNDSSIVCTERHSTTNHYENFKLLRRPWLAGTSVPIMEIESASTRRGLRLECGGGIRRSGVIRGRPISEYRSDSSEPVVDVYKCRSVSAIQPPVPSPSDNISPLPDQYHKTLVRRARLHHGCQLEPPHPCKTQCLLLTQDLASSLLRKTVHI